MPPEIGLQAEIPVGRQAIYDRNKRVVAYELLYRDSQGRPGIQTSGEQATSRVMLHAFVDLGVERMVGPHQAFINFTDDLILSLPDIPFYPNRLVLEIVEDTKVDDRLMRAVSDLSDRGYVIALHDSGCEGEALRCALDYERHRWDQVTYRRLKTEEICTHYLQGTELAFQAGSALGTP